MKNNNMRQNDEGVSSENIKEITGTLLLLR